MNGAAAPLLVRHYLLRASREPFGLFIFTVLPLAIIAILSAIYSGNTAAGIYVNGYNMVSTHISIGMMLLFQLNGGIYLLDYLNHDLEKPMKWRLKAAPRPVHAFVFSGAAACTIFTVLQGMLIVAVTSLFMKAYWGSIVITTLVILLVSFISQLIGMLLFLLVRNLSTAEALSWLIATGMAAMSGFVFPFQLPENHFFQFMKSYGTPFSLGQSAIRHSGFMGGSVLTAWLCLAALAGFCIVLAGFVVVLGRRKLA